MFLLANMCCRSQIGDFLNHLYIEKQASNKEWRESESSPGGATKLRGAHTLRDGLELPFDMRSTDCVRY